MTVQVRVQIVGTACATKLGCLIWICRDVRIVRVVWMRIHRQERKRRKERYYSSFPARFCSQVYNAMSNGGEALLLDARIKPCSDPKRRYSGE